MQLWRTALASGVLVLVSYAAAASLTHDFQVWTAEGARRLELALHPLPAPRLVMDGPAAQGQTLERLLAGEGAVTLIDFMYTRCTSVCAALGGTFQQLQLEILQGGRAPGSAPLRLLSISFDPDHDDAAVLAHYAGSLRAEAQVWRFARVADPAGRVGRADARRLLDHYQVTVIPDGFGGFEHNAALLVTDPTGRLVRVFDYAEREVALAYARELASERAAR